MNATTETGPEAPDISVPDLAAIQFNPLPDAATLGRDRDQWHSDAEAARQMVVLAGSVLSKTAAELRQAIRDTDAKSWADMLDAFRAEADQAKALARTLEAAYARGLIALAGVTEGVEGTSCAG